MTSSPSICLPPSSPSICLPPRLHTPPHVLPAPASPHSAPRPSRPLRPHPASPQLPNSRVAVLAGSSGDLSAWGAPSISYSLAPGHTPGHLVFMHQPSGVLVAGDAISLILPSIPGLAKEVDPGDNEVGGWVGGWEGGARGKAAVYSGLVGSSLTAWRPEGMHQPTVWVPQVGC